MLSQLASNMLPLLEARVHRDDECFDLQATLEADDLTPEPTEPVHVCFRRVTYSRLHSYVLFM